MDLRLVATAGAVVALLTTAGCTSTVDAQELEKGVSAKVQAAAGSRPSALSCEDLEAEKGATTTCAMTLAGQAYDVTITVTSVKDGTVRYTVDPRPREKK